jgi:hypothetical protein
LRFSFDVVLLSVASHDGRVVEKQSIRYLLGITLL